MALFASLTFFFGPILFILIVVENERLNRNQTWRLAPISDGKFYVANILSSFVSLVYFVLLDVLIAICFLFLSIFTNTKFGKNLQIKVDLNSTAVLSFIGIILLLILTCLFLYFLVSFLNFSSQAILDFLPHASSHILISFVRIFIIIVLVGLLVRLYSVFANYIINILLLRSTGLAGLESVVLMMFIIDLIILGINVFLINHFLKQERSKN
ncbi:hypothetical protein SDC49_22590 [Lactobacillus sp. R2/2]|nr:hypothetical protein [Lactobacillus sp. R2/2]